MNFLYHSAVLSGDARRNILLEGKFLVQTQVPAMVDLCKHALDLVYNVFKPFDPEFAHENLLLDDYMNCIDSLHKKFIFNKKTQNFLLALLNELGIDLDDAFCDRFNLRILPPKYDFQFDKTKKLWAHRDTWCSNVYQQINLWAPICPISETRTITILPDYWLKPIANNSGKWDILQLRRDRRIRKKDKYPSIPNVLEDAVGLKVPVLINPGDIFSFSGAHLHESTVEDRLRARISFDFRVVSLKDLRSGISAPNCDGDAVHRNFGWFNRFTDGASLTEFLEKN